jgi:hypothetical protein
MRPSTLAPSVSAGARRSQQPFTPRRAAFVASLVLIFMIPWEGAVEAPGIGTGARLMGFLAGGLWIVSVIARRGFRTPVPFHLVFFAFVAWNALSLYWSIDTARTLERIGTWVQLLILVLIIWDLYATRAALLAGLQAYVLGAHVAVGVAVANFRAGDFFYSNMERYTTGSTNPDGFGVVLALAIPVAWYLGAMKSPVISVRLGAFLNYSYIPMALLGIALSGTRTAVVAAIPGMLLGLALLSRLRRRVQISVLLLFTLALLAIAPVVSGLKSFNRLGTTGSAIAEGDFNGRRAIWSDGFASFADHPIVGVGANSYRSVSQIGKVAHNSFLSVLVELGAIGLILFTVSLWMALSRAWRLPTWPRAFWMTVLLVWGIGASTLTYEHKKVTWLLLSLLIVSYGLVRGESVTAEVVSRENRRVQPPPVSG